MDRKLLILVILINCMLLTNSFKLLKSSIQENQETGNLKRYECQNNVYEYHNMESLSKSNLLEKVMEKLSQKNKKLSNVTIWKGINYRLTLYDIVIKNWQFNSTNQTVSVLNSDTIKLTNSSIKVFFDYKWQLVNYYVSQTPQYKKGTGSSYSQTVNCSFTIRILSSGRLWLIDYTYPQFYYFSLGSIDGDQIEQYWFLMIYYLLSQKSVLTSPINQFNNLVKYDFLSYATQALADSFLIVKQYSPYQWNQGNSSITIPILRKINEINLEKDEINLSYESFVSGYEDRRCGTQLPNINLNPKQYGGSQQFISLSLFSNLIDYAIENQLLYTDLNNDQWGTQIFNFTAKSLYPIFYRLALIFKQTDPVTGFCNVVNKSQNITRSSNTTANLTISSNCTLNVKNKKIYEFSIDVSLQIQGKALQNQLDFTVKSFDHEITKENDSFGFKMINPDLVEKYINQSLKRLNDKKLLGTGWPLNTKRNNPYFMIEKDYMFISDLSTIKMDQNN